MKSIICVICGTEFTHHGQGGGTVKTCSIECRKEKRKRQGRTKYLAKRDLILKKLHDRYVPHPRKRMSIDEFKKRRKASRIKFWSTHDRTPEQIEAKRLYDIEYRKKYKARKNELSRKWYHENKDIARAKSRIASKKSRNKNHMILRERNRLRQLNNPAEYRERNSLRYNVGLSALDIRTKQALALIHLFRRVQGLGNIKTMDSTNISNILEQIKKGETHVAYAD